MKHPERLSTITRDDLKALRSDLCPVDIEKYQNYLDATRSGLDYLRLSDGERAQVRRAVEDPSATLAGPELLLWNNIQRHHKQTLRF